MSAPQRPGARRPPPISPARPGRSCAILVAEEDAATGALLHAALAGAGHRVAVARGLAAATGALATVRFDLVLAGSPLTGPDGPCGDRWAALERLRALAAGAPVVVAGAHRPERLAAWRGRGFAALLAKPVDLDTLRAIVDEQLAPRRAAGKGARAPLEGR